MPEPAPAAIGASSSKLISGSHGDLSAFQEEISHVLYEHRYETALLGSKLQAHMDSSSGAINSLKADIAWHSQRLNTLSTQCDQILPASQDPQPSGAVDAADAAMERRQLDVVLDSVASVEKVIEDMSSRLVLLEACESARASSSGINPRGAEASAAHNLDTSQLVDMQSPLSQMAPEERARTISTNLTVADSKPSRNPSHLTDLSQATESGRVMESWFPCYDFQESLWDASVFIGLQHVGVGASLVTCAILVVNVMMQILYTFLVLSEFTYPAFGARTIQSFRNFRLRIAHDAKHLDAVTQVSLAARVCSDEPMTHIAGAQVDAVGSVNRYLTENKYYPASSGPLMCILACALWTFVVNKELRNIANLTMCMWKFIIDEGFKTTRVIFRGGSWGLEGVSKSRFIMINVVLMMRLCIASVLLIAGLQWLIHTVEVRDLVLNAIALECVMLLDEQFFAAFVPLHVAYLVRSLKGLPMPRWCCYRGADLPGTLGLLGCFALMAALVPTWLATEIDYLRNARNELCSGNLDFVFGTYEYAPYYAWSATPSFNSAAVTNEFAESLTESIIKGHTNGTIEEARMPALQGATFSVESIRRESIRDATARFNWVCRDQFRSFYEDALISKGGIGIKSCIDLISHCEEDNSLGAAARSICPESCGCHLPNSTLVLSSFVAGCPETCPQQADYQAVLANASCIDQSPQALNATTAWRARANTPVSIAFNTPYSKTIQDLLEAVRTLMINYGCNSIHMLHTVVDLCDETPNRGFPFKSLRLFCPVSCSCKSTSTNCPRQCPSL